jgi:hypothetical protein
VLPARGARPARVLKACATYTSEAEMFVVMPWYVLSEGG